MSRRERRQAIKADRQRRARKTPPAPPRPRNPVKVTLAWEPYVEFYVLTAHGDSEPVFGHAQYSPMGICPHHGLEPYNGIHLYVTGPDRGVCDKFTCGTIDLTQVF